MIKSNLPVILLKNLVLLPYQEVRIELNSIISKKTIEISKLYHDNELLLVCPLNSLEENPDENDLPKIGVVGKIRSSIDLPNGNLRVIIEGLYRSEVVNYVNYSNDEDIIDSIVTNVNEILYSEIEIAAYTRKLLSELENYIEKNSFVSNSILSQVKNMASLDTLTDVIANFLPLSLDKRLSYMLDTNCISRAKSLIKEIEVENAIIDLETKIENDIRESLDKEQKEYILKEKIKVIQKELGLSNTKEDDISSLKERINKLKLPTHVMNKLNKEIERYIQTSEISPDSGIIRNYIEYLLNVPWNNSSTYERNISKIEDSLNSIHYGFEEAKNRIIEYMAVKETTDEVNSPIICLVGPPGVGKTTFAENISKSLKRRFAKISLGGMSDSAELVGHRRAYIGSNPGKIVSSLIKCGCNNPVFLLDEVDKIKSDYKGDPSSTLLDILDTSQNKRFVDNYIDEELDLSKVLFILTANDINSIPQALLDRLEIIELSGYSDQEKQIIAEKYLIPIMLKKHGLNKNSIEFTSESIKCIIEKYTNESGVRELERCISKVIRKVITDSLKSNIKLDKIVINEKDISKYLNIEVNLNELISIKYPGIVRSVACTNQGGVALNVECTSYSGKGEYKCSGSLGNIAKESIDVAISYIKSKSKEFDIDTNYFDTHDLHIHFTDAGVNKDGPSAGIAIITAILSLIKNTKIPSNISMSGEVSLKGEVLLIGGLKEKAIASVRNKINTVYIPYQNIKDIKLFDKDLKNSIKFIPVKDYIEVYNDLFKK